MRRRQGTRRVYFKDNFYEPTFAALPSFNFAHLKGNNTWAWSNTHPDAATYEPWASNYHMGNVMTTPNAAGWHTCLATQTASKFQNTKQPYTDPTTGDGGLEPVIFEYCINHDPAGGNDMSFLFFYTAATDIGYAMRHRSTGGAGTAVMELCGVNNVGAIPVFTVLASWDVDDLAATAWRAVRIYYTPIDYKYGGSTLVTAGYIEVFVSDGTPVEQPKNYLEGEGLASATRYTANLDPFNIPVPDRLTSGDSIGFLVGANVDGYINGVKYCRHWDVNITSVNYMTRMILGEGILNMTLMKPRDEEFDTSGDAQIGYEKGDRIECQIKSRILEYNNPGVVTEYIQSSIIDFDGTVDDIKNAGGSDERSDITARCFYSQLVRYYETFTFLAASDLEAAFKTIAPLSSLKYNVSAMNGYGVEPALNAITFTGAKDFKGLTAHDVMRRLNVFANTWSTWHPEGTMVVSDNFPNDASYTLDMYDQSQNPFILFYAEIEQGTKMINSVAVMSPLAATQTQTVAAFPERYGDHGMPFIVSRESDTTDMQVYGDNLVNSWHHKRKLIDVYTMAGMGWMHVGDIVTVTIPGLGLSSVDFQIIEKNAYWGEKYPTLSSNIIFRLCEYIDANTAPIWYVGANEEIMDISHTGREALGQHA